jgi:hypothetical protein
MIKVLCDFLIKFRIHKHLLHNFTVYIWSEYSGSEGYFSSTQRNKRSEWFMSTAFLFFQVSLKKSYVPISANLALW